MHRPKVLGNQPAVSQITDSVVKQDTAVQVKAVVQTYSWQQDTAYTKIYKNLYAGNNSRVVFMINSIRQPVTGTNYFICWQVYCF